VTGATPALQEQFTRALETHLTQGGEAALLSAYELGRRAMNEHLGVLDVATLLQNALLTACRKRPREGVRTVQAAGGFVLECLSSFEMAHRAVREANTALRGLNDLLEEQTKRISHELRPTILDDLGLIAALEFLSEGVAARTGLWIKVEGPRDERFPSTIETVLYRVAQEALNNVAKHAQASAATIVVKRESRRVSCTVRDVGVGFDPASGHGGPKGLGRIGIRERLAPIRGALSVDSAPGRGTELRVTIPL
jgi:hypothetical protein